MMLKILSAFYDKLDVTDKVKSFIEQGTLEVLASNDVFGDPAQYKVKKLTVSYEIDGKTYSAFAYEGSKLRIPEEEASEKNKILLITSCNRIKQTILAITINSYIIKDKFHLIIADSSTPGLSAEDGLIMHNKEPYNHITKESYCSNLNLFDEYIKLLPNITSYKVIHVSPRLEKAQGDASLITIGLAQASLIGSIGAQENYCLKLTGVSILNEDILSDLDKNLKDKDVLAFHRSHFGHGEYSTRVFGCRPNTLGPALQKAGWRKWVNPQAGDTEFRFADIINEFIPSDRILYTGKDESCLLDNGGSDKIEAREKIKNQISKNNIPLSNPIIKEFMDGGIW
jgi:hypothetical protein